MLISLFIQAIDEPFRFERVPEKRVSLWIGDGQTVLTMVTYTKILSMKSSSIIDP